jgi:FkbM family methyltransferase
MKAKMLKAANTLLGMFDAKIVKKKVNDLNISSAIERLYNHGILIDSIVDIGASNGTWSVDAMNYFPNASYLAIEPLHERKFGLEDLYKTYPNFDYILCAAGEKDNQEIQLSVSKDLNGSTVDGSVGVPRTVSVKTIDAIVSKKKLLGPFLLKLDTHGYEVPILNGAERTLKQTNAIVMEVYNFEISKHAKIFHEMCFHMDDLGFRCYDIANPMHRPYDSAFWQMDIFFCRKNFGIFKYSNFS